MGKDLSNEEQKDRIKVLEDIIRDHKKKTDAQLRDSVNTLASAIVHKFNNILAGIMGYADLALMDVDEYHPTYKSLMNIKKAVRKGKNFNSRLIGFAGGGRYNPTEFDLNETVKASLAEFNASYSGEQIGLELYHEPLNIVFDKDQLSLILADLYNNAAEATGGKNEIMVRTRWTMHDKNEDSIEEAGPGSYARLDIEDRGCGMDRETKSRIFQPFFTTKTKGDHLGLSLASAYEVIKASGGQMTFVSHKDFGTNFSIYLKLAGDKVPENDEEASVHQSRQKKTILIAEDEPNLRETYCMVLKDEGYEVITAEDGIDALAKYEQDRDRIGLVILDRTMPNMTGDEAFYELRKRYPGISVLVMSALGRDETIEGMLKAGAVGYIDKPFNVYEFQNRVSKAYCTPVRARELKEE